jgi:hypothetical protein
MRPQFFVQVTKLHGNQNKLGMFNEGAGNTTQNLSIEDRIFN